MKTQHDRPDNFKGSQQDNARNAPGSTKPNHAPKDAAPIVAAGEKSGSKSTKDAEQTLKPNKDGGDRGSQRSPPAQDKKR